MAELIKRLSLAHRICEKAYAHVERAEHLETRRVEAKETRNHSYAIAAIVPVLVLFIADAVSGLTHGISLLAWVPFAIIYPIRKCRSASATFKEADSNLQTQIAREWALAEKTIDVNSEKLGVLPQEYWYPLATENILMYVQQGRAETLGQALNLYDEMLYRCRIEQTNNAMLELQQEQVDQLKGIRRNSAVSAVANVATATASIGRGIMRWL